MTKKKKKKKSLPQKLQAWAEARQRYRLSDKHVQMARELGMNPKKMGGIANHHQEPWKMPLQEYIVHLYEKRFGKSEPERAVSLETLAKEVRRKKEERRKAKLERGGA
jgi:hypothetical protein